MVHARPIPGYNAASDPISMANGHEEINLEARRRHREEKQPPIEDDTEKILTIGRFSNGRKTPIISINIQSVVTFALFHETSTGFVYFLLFLNRTQNIL